MKVKIIKDHNFYTNGDEYTLNDAAANYLIRVGVAKRSVEKSKVVKKKAVKKTIKKKK